jgi:hypothetical protein
MLHRIEVNVIYVPLEVRLIANSVLPKSTLPKGIFTITMTRNAYACFGDGGRETTLDEMPPIGKVRVPRWQSHYDVQMIGKHHDGIDYKRISLSHYANGCP